MMLATEPPTTARPPASGAAAGDWLAAVAARGPVQAAAQACGAFSVALDLPDGRRFAAVDRFAQRSLCWTLRDGQWRVAERADRLGAEEIDEQAIYDYLYFHAIPSPRTVFAGVHRLPPGHLALWEGGRVTVRPYWTPRFEPVRDPDPGALGEEFRGLLRRAVAARIGGGPAACFLSGGTDSSTVAGLLQQLSGRAHAYSIGFDAPGYDEMSYARIAARHFGLVHREHYVTPDELLRHIPAVAASFDQPFGNSSVLPAYCCALQARADGADRMLAGDGGDELFGGNSRYATQRLYEGYGRLPALLRRAVIEPLVPALSRLPLLRKAASYVRDARMPLPDRLQNYNLLYRLGAGEVLDAGWLARVDAQQPLRLQREVWQQAQADAVLDRNLAFDWRFTLAESDLPKVNAATGLAGVEVAYPLLDDDLLAFSMRLPVEYKLRGMDLRWFFKQALREFLPPQIIAKKKKGFGLPFGLWTTQHPALREFALDSVHALVRRGLVRGDFVRTLCDEHLPAHPGYYGELVWILMMLEQWLRAHAPHWRAAAAGRRP